MLNKNNKKEITAIEDLIKAKVFVSPTRFKELCQLKDDLWKPDAELQESPCSLLCFNLSPEVEEVLRRRTGYTLQVERITEDRDDPSHKEDRKRFLKVFGGKKLQENNVAAIVHELHNEDDLTLLDRRVIALSLMNKLPVLLLTTHCPGVLAEASAATGDTWPVFLVPNPEEDMGAMCQWLTEELPRVRALSSSIEADLQARVAHLGRVNAPLHFLSRASLALVPFGVMTVNFLGILRLMANMLQCVGMRGDTSANKALGLLGAKNAALVTSIDSMGDVYSFAVFSTVLADLQMMSLVEAAEALTVLDGLMLGSISVVTGAVSALGAYLSRPIIVRAAAEFLASLQTIYVMNPAMRREVLPRRGEGRVRKHTARWYVQKERKGGVDKAEMRGLLMRCTHEGGRAGGRRGRRREEEAEAAIARSGPERKAGARMEGSLEESGREVEGELGEREGERKGDQEQDEEEEEVTGGEESEDTEGQQEEEEEEERVPLLLPGSQEGRADPSAEVAGGLGTGGASGEGSGAEGAGTISRAERKQPNALQRKEAKAAARAAKEAEKAAQKAAKAEKQAAKLAEREHARQTKQQERERKLEEKAAAAQVKAEEKAAVARRKAEEKAAAAQRKADDKAAAKIAKSKSRPASELEPSAPSCDDGKTALDRTNTGSAAETSDDATRPAANEGRGALDASEAAVGERTSSGVGRCAGMSDSSGRGSGSGSDGDGASAAAGGEDEEAAVQRRLDAALAREERMGLDEEACRGLLQFLSLADEEVYGDGQGLSGNGGGEDLRT